MDTPSNAPFRFRLTDIVTQQFATQASDAFAGEVDEVAAGFTFAIDPERREVTVAPRLEFILHDQSLVILQVAVQFQIFPDDWPRLIPGDGEGFCLPLTLVQHLCVIAIGTSRGILHEKLQSVPAYRQLQLPILDLTQILQEDITFTQET